MYLTILMTFALLCPQDSRQGDLAAARELFQRNLEAIQQRDREGYLDCYVQSADLIRASPEGPALGWAELDEGTPASGSDEWPTTLVARDMQLHWIEDGWVYGSYRYRVDFSGTIVEGLSERLFRRTDDGWRIVMTSAFAAWLSGSCPVRRLLTAVPSPVLSSTA